MKAKQKKWIALDIPDMKGKVVVITGANTGLGKETALLLALNGAEVILACRSLKKGESAKQEILKHNSKAKVQVRVLDLQDLSSIQQFSKDFSKDFARLDVLINNAGIMNTPYELTKDGFESQLGTNHLGHFALTGLLLKKLKSTKNSRVVTVSSAAHRFGKMDFKNLLFENGKNYSPIKAYARSKLANLLFTYELQRQFNVHHIDCLSLAAHPGASQTDLGRHIEDAAFFKVFNPVLKQLIQGADKGALPQIRAATDAHVKGGEYYGPDGAFEMSGYPVKVSSSRNAQNVADAKRLWQQSEQLTGVVYSFL